jgi:Putative metallopeptidase
MGRSALLLCAAAACLAASAEARADIVVIRGVELQLPANWVMQDKASYTTLRPKTSKGRAVQVISLPAMPPAKPGEVPVGEDGKLVIPQVKELERDGVKLVAASGKLVTKGTELAVDMLAIPVDGKAVMLMSYVGSDQDPLIRDANAKILLSARVPGPRMKITFEAPTKQGAVGLSDALVKDLTAIIQIFDAAYRLPRALPVAIKDCNTPNAFYSSAHSITLCHELYAYFLDVFKKGGVPDDKLATLAHRAYLFTFMHEFGHALVGELALPITGKGEDAADEYATLLLASAGKLGHEAALAGARWFDITRKDPTHKNIFYDTHSFDEQRLVSITCLLYGKDPKGYADLMKALSIPASRLAKCSRDYPLRLKAWNGMLGPYTITRQKKS